MKVKRDFYLNALRRKMHNGLVKIVTGIRRCGKSYLLSVLFKEYLMSQGVAEDHIIEVPLDNDEFLAYRDAISLGEYVRKRLVRDGQWNYVFIDEVQLARKILPARRRWSATAVRSMRSKTGATRIRGIQQECFWKQGKRTWDWISSSHGLRRSNSGIIIITLLKGIQKLDKKSRTKGFIQDCRDPGVYKKNEVQSNLS